MEPDKPIFDFNPPPEAITAETKPETKPETEVQPEPAAQEPPPAVEPPKAAEPPKVDTVPFNKFEREKQRRREAEEKARNLALEAERYKGMVEGMKKPEPVQMQEVKAPTAPKLEDFADWDSYDTAKTEWIAEQKLSAYRTSVREQMEKEASEKAEAARKQAEIETHQRYVQAVQARVREAGEANPDFAAVVQGEAAAHFSDAVLKMMVDSDKFPDMTYYLASNVDKLDRLVTLANVNPVAAAREVGNLEAAFRYGTPVKRTSTAPAPVIPLTPAASKIEHEESAEDYIRRRNREDSERRTGSKRR